MCVLMSMTWTMRAWQEDESPAERVPMGDLAMFRQLGFAAAAGGLDIDGAHDRMRALLAASPRRDRRRLDHASVAVAIIDGWMEGMAQRPMDTSVEVLRRLGHEQYRRCEVLDLDPAEQYVLVVFRLHGSDDHLLEAGIAVAVDVARATFNRGECLATAKGRLLVLAPRTEQLAARVHHLAAKMQLRLDEYSLSVTCGLEPLSSDERWLDDLLDSVLP